MIARFAEGASPLGTPSLANARFYGGAPAVIHALM
jgi:hypothetical protein